MAAEITIIEGVGAGQSIWIEHPVVRIGSDPTADVCLPDADLPNHAATVEYRGGQYTVYGYSDVPLMVNEQLIDEGQSGTWRDGQTVRIGTFATMILEATGDGRPEPRPKERHDLEPMPDEPAGAEPTSDSPPGDSAKTIVQIAVILVCLLGVAWMLLNPGTGKQTSAQRPAIAPVLESVDWSKTSPTHHLTVLVRNAEMSRLRGDLKKARAKYEEIRDQWRRRQEALENAGQELPQDEETLLRFVVHQLADLP